MQLPTQIEDTIAEYKLLLADNDITQEEFEEMIEDLATNSNTMKALSQENAAITAYSVAVAVKTAAGLF